MQFGRDAISGATFAHFPSPLPPTSGGGWLVCHQLALLWNCSVLPLFLSNATRSSPFSPHLLVADASVWATSPLGVVVGPKICGFYLFIYFLPVMLPSEIPELPTSGCLLVFGNFSCKTHYPGWVSIPNSCLSFYLLYFVLPPFEDNGLPFWVPDVLHQRSEVVLWYFLSIQMIFQ